MILSKNLSVVFSAFCIVSSIARPLKRTPANLITKCQRPNSVALTFDDGPGAHTLELLDTLQQANASATFFINGFNFGKCIYDPGQVDQLKRVISDGHELGSHTWAHKNLSTLSFDEVHDEFFRVEEAMEKIVGLKPALMRPPFGSFNPIVSEVAGARGQSIVLWDFDSGDSVGKTLDEQKALYDQIATTRPENVLALNHDVIETTVRDIVPHALQVLKSAGYDLVTVSECLGIPAYQSQSAPQERDDTWVCRESVQPPPVAVPPPPTPTVAIPTETPSVPVPPPAVPTPEISSVPQSSTSTSASGVRTTIVGPFLLILPAATPTAS